MYIIKKKQRKYILQKSFIKSINKIWQKNKQTNVLVTGLTQYTKDMYMKMYTKKIINYI
jgi:hypothetical protein